jgi:hypothetical protein
MPNHKARLHADQHRYLGTAQAIAKPHRLEVVTGSQVMAKRQCKRPVDWLKQEETQEYLTALGEALNCDPESLLKTKRGRYDGGTWLHPKLGAHFTDVLRLPSASVRVPS